MVEYNPISDIKDLLEYNWFNDRIINKYLDILESLHNDRRVRCLSTFFYQYLDKKPSVLKENFSSYLKVIIPIHKDQHWHLIEIDNVEKEINIYDSLVADIKPATKIKEYMVSFQNDITDSFKYIIKVRNHGKQPNGSDCGLYVCLSARSVITGENFPLTSKNLYEYRVRIAITLLKKHSF